MKSLLILITIITFSSCATMRQGKGLIEGVYPVSCGTCVFEMTGDECQMAIKIDNKYYYVEGPDLHEFGDAHAEDGLCNVERKAHVVGMISKGVVIAEEFELLPYEN